MLVTLFRLLSHLPLSMLHAIGVVAGWFVYRLSPSYRARLQENLIRAGFGGQLSVAIRESGKNIFELPFIWCAPPKKVLATARIEGWSVVQEAIAQGHGIIFLTPHLGCFEIIAQVIASRMTLTALYRPPRQSILKPLMEGARRRPNLHLAPANLRGVRILLRTLKEGGAVGLLPDQVPQNGEGVWADFFGKPAYTMTLPAKLHQLTNAPIVLSYAERLPHGTGFVVRFISFDAMRTADLQQQTESINGAMEALITHCPSQYFWGYNRYKTPSGVMPPAENPS
jgi:KDO2-lipid IV(A) lauroyltransferase